MTLHSEPIPITVEGGAAVASSAGGAPPGSATPATAARAASPATTANKPQDILYQLTERPQKAVSFAPIYTRNVFWAAQVFPLLALIGFAGLEDSPGEN